MTQLLPDETQGKMKKALGQAKDKLKSANTGITEFVGKIKSKSKFC